MKKKSNLIILVCALVLIVVLFKGCPKSLDEDPFTVAKVINGNTLQLENGYEVVLLGVYPTKNTADFLNKYVNTDVYFIFDSSSPVPLTDDSNQKFYAYVALSKYDGPCINSLILKNGLAPLNESPNLTDSLDVYREYAKNFKGTIEQYIPETPIADNIQIPAFVQPNDGYAAEQQHFYDDEDENCEMLKHVVDYRSPCTRGFAVQLAARHQGEYNIAQVCEIFKFLYNNWKYVNDPVGQDYVARASESICQLHFKGDCDDFAVAMAACVLSIGGNARINTAQSSEGGHAFCEVNISKMDENDVLNAIKQVIPNANIDMLCTNSDDSGKWLNLDWWASYPGGKYFKYDTRTIYECNPENQTWILFSK
jgi:hypothetical protein